MLNVFHAQSLHAKPLPRRSNLVNYSLFKTLDSWIDFRSFSIKYVCNGLEKYTVNQNTYYVKSGQYILANEHASGKVEIESNEWVRGICIDISPELLAEALASQLRPDTLCPDLNLDRFFNSPDFLDNLYSAQQTAVGQLLTQLDASLSSGALSPDAIPQNLYYNMATALVQDHIPIYLSLQNIPSVKWQTSKILYKKVSEAKAVIEHQTHEAIDVAQLALHVQMSPYHFHRIFQKTFNISPYHYSLRVRLNHAMTLMAHQKYSITEAAMATGFSDISSFSKTYKKHFGSSPSQLTL
ncbi:MAG: helix-turn-helix transcriptional regulator [Saprospiraceae bacterium]|nr:helix-turn-helix transcriptional regulator [Saprospiraceae bacterium]